MPPAREEEPRRRKKDYDRDTSSRTSTKDKDRHRSAKKPSHRRTSSTSKDPSRDGSASRPEDLSTPDVQAKSVKKKVTMIVPEMERRSSTGTHTSSYPTFSKEHSREAVRGREDVNNKSKGPTAAPGESPAKTRPSTAEEARSGSPVSGAAPTRPPPSPPLTEEEVSATTRGEGSVPRKRTSEKLKADSRRSHRSSDSLRPSSAHRHKPSSEETEDSDISERRKRSSHKSSREEQQSRSRVSHKSSHRSSKTSHQDSVVTDQTETSASTSRPGRDEAKRQPHPPGLTTTETYSPSSQPSPCTPSSNEPSFGPKSYPPQAVPVFHTSDPPQPLQVLPAASQTPPLPTAAPPPRPASMGSLPQPPTPYGVAYSPAPYGFAQPSTPGTMGPPPPPPPVIVPEVAPRVDYLLRNGGLPSMIPKTFMPSIKPQPIQHYSTYQSPRMDQGSAPGDHVQVFTPFHSKLNNVQTVLGNNGSLAVATGYRSIARRLLDRLEHVFSRSINTERCCCVMCKTRIAPDEYTNEEELGYNWGEILEFVCGRKELPQWPPFSITRQPGGLGIDVGSNEPMQYVDPDVPEEWHAHFKRQNAKTKRAVMGWLQKSEEVPTAPPTDIDDETLMFAITTRLAPERRPMLVALRRGLDKITPENEASQTAGKNEVLSKVSLALKRLYRLQDKPRDSECCIYLLNNPNLHDVLFTLAAVNEQEWGVLISGRFEGFLWSGAEAPEDFQYGPYTGSRFSTPFDRNGTPYGTNGALPVPRNNTPFSPTRNLATPDPCMFPSRGTTPGPGLGGPATPAPIAYDEEMEITILAEMEREIFRGMEELEDQFEKLHAHAQAVRIRLRERSAGLAITAKTRQGSMYDEPRVRGNTPADAMGNGWNGSSIWSPDPQEGIFLDDGRSELAPDDSASNIGYDKRPSRRARRTPAAVPEEEEEYHESGRKKSSPSHHRR